MFGCWGRELRFQIKRAKLHVLVAEDNVINQKYALSVLENEGHSVVVVGNGREALAALDRDSFDLVLMDIHMPDIDGFEATSSIRARERFTGSRTPIIAVTAHAMTGDRDKCLAAGMDGYVSKPIRKAALVEAISDPFLAKPQLRWNCSSCCQTTREGFRRTCLRVWRNTYRNRSPGLGLRPLNFSRESPLVFRPLFGS